MAHSSWLSAHPPRPPPADRVQVLAGGTAGPHSCRDSNATHQHHPLTSSSTPPAGRLPTPVRPTSTPQRGAGGGLRGSHDPSMVLLHSISVRARLLLSVPFHSRGQVLGNTLRTSYQVGVLHGAFPIAKADRVSVTFWASFKRSGPGFAGSWFNCPGAPCNGSFPRNSMQLHKVLSPVGTCPGPALVPTSRRMMPGLVNLDSVLNRPGRQTR